MRINYNISSIIARNCLNNNDSRLADSIERLSSGLKINSAADDAAGMAISLKMSAQIKALKQANNNANDGISVVNTADGAMTEMHEILQRMNELAIQAANGTNADSDREQIQLEIDQLVEELDRIAETTQFNAQNLLDGTFAYKGYTNTENVKVMSYSDGVASGTYVIQQLQYYHDENTIKDYGAYIDDKHSNTGEIIKEEKYAAGTGKDDDTPEDNIKNALYTSSSISAGMKAFPDGAKVILDDENIIIQGQNDFEVKLTVNNRDAVKGKEIATTSTSVQNIATDCFRNVIVSDGTKKYTIKEMNIVTTTVGSNKTVEVKAGSVTDPLSNLSDYFKDAFATEFPDKTIKVTSCSYTNNKITIEAQAADDTSTPPATKFKEFDVIIETPNEWDEAKKGKYIDSLPDKVKGTGTGTPPSDANYLNQYLYTHTDTVRTCYTVGGKDDPIKLDLTGIGAMRLQVGANEGQVIAVEIPALQALYMGLNDLDISTEDKATAAIDKIGDAINQLSGIRAKIGAYANRIEHTIANLDSTEENMTAAYSRIMDVDMATEMTEYSTVQVLVESSTAMLAQANERPQTALQLLQ